MATINESITIPHLQEALQAIVWATVKMTTQGI